MDSTCGQRSRSTDNEKMGVLQEKDSGRKDFTFADPL